MQLQNIIDFGILSYFLGKLRNEISSTYVSKTTSITGPVYIGVGDSTSDVYINNNLQADSKFDKTLSLNCNNKYIYVLYPSSNTKSIVISIGNLNVPVENLTTVTLDNVSYYVLRSSNAYSYTGEVKFSVK